MMQVLIVKMSALGDIIHAFPAVQYIKERYPEAKIDWVVEQPFAGLVQAHPNIDQVFTVHTKKWRSRPFSRANWQELSAFSRSLRTTTYSIVLDLQGNIKSGCVTACAQGVVKAGFGFSTAPEKPNLLATHKRINPPQGRNIRDDYLFMAQSVLGDFSPLRQKGICLKLTEPEQKKMHSLRAYCRTLPAEKVLVCPGSNWPNKQLSWQGWRDFLRSFWQRFPQAHFLLLWGTENEKALVDKLAAPFSGQTTVLDKLTLPLLQNLMAMVDLVVAMDSLPLHLAGTTATPTFSVFGASAADKYKPVGSAHYALQGTCPYGKRFEKRCPRLRTCPTGACIKRLEGAELFASFFSWWSSGCVKG